MAWKYSYAPLLAGDHPRPEPAGDDPLGCPYCGNPDPGLLEPDETGLVYCVVCSRTFPPEEPR